MFGDTAQVMLTDNYWMKRELLCYCHGTNFTISLAVTDSFATLLNA